MAYTGTPPESSPIRQSSTAVLEQLIFDKGVDPDCLTQLYDILDGSITTDEQYHKTLKLILEILTGMAPI